MDVKDRLEYLRGQIRAECISMDEIVELQGYGADDLIDESDVELREWAGLPEFPEDEPTYMIVRFFFDQNKDRKIIQRGLTLEEAQAHCQDESTHGGSTDDGTAWFDGYEEE